MPSANVQRAITMLDMVSSAALHRSDPKARNAINEALGALRLDVSLERPSGWIPARYHIALRDPVGKCEVDGIKLMPRLLGIHIAAEGSADVTHIPSGGRLASFQSLGAAIEFVEVIKDLYEWQQPSVANIPDDLQRLILGAARVHQDRAFLPRKV